MVAPKVIVVGAGILGTATAADLAQAGADVTLVARAGADDGASNRSFSWLNVADVYPPAYHQLRLLGIERHRAFVGRHPGAGWLHAAGRLDISPPPAEHVAQLRARGYAVTVVDRAQAARIEPALAVDRLPADGIAYAPDEGWVDLAELVGALRRLFLEASGTLMRVDDPAGIAVAAGRVVGVRLGPAGPLRADVVVNATGAAVTASLADVGVSLPTATNTGAVLHVSGVDRLPRTIVRSSSVSVRPAGRGQLAVQSDPADQTVRAGDDGAYRMPADVVSRTAAQVARLLGQSTPVVVDRVQAGLRPVPGDGLSVVGELPEIAGYYVLHSHSSATLGLILGELAAAEILSGDRAALLADFRPERFAGATG